MYYYPVAYVFAQYGKPSPISSRRGASRVPKRNAFDAHIQAKPVYKSGPNIPPTGTFCSECSERTLYPISKHRRAGLLSQWPGKRSYSVSFFAWTASSSTTGSAAASPYGLSKAPRLSSPQIHQRTYPPQMMQMTRNIRLMTPTFHRSSLIELIPKAMAADPDSADRRVAMIREIREPSAERGKQYPATIGELACQ